MADENTPEIKQDAVVETPVQAAPEMHAPKPGFAGRGNRDRRGGPRGGRPGGRRGGDDRRSEFAQKLIGIRRVARVMAGGRRFNFSAALVLGDKKGRVGVGLGTAADTALAIEKATRVEIRPSPGRGLVAGSSVRTVLELGGVSDVTAKLLSRSKNPVNNARAAIKALQQAAAPLPKNRAPSEAGTAHL